MKLLTRWMRRPALALALAALLLLPLGGLAASAPVAPPLPTERVADPHQSGVQWYAPTGHTLRGDFLAYWTGHGSLAQFGYPITEEFSEMSGPNGTPLVVQYFERNRFEHHPESSDAQYRVLLGSLGRTFHKQDPPVPAMANPAAQYFSETGHNVMPPFTTYWQQHGGLATHGYPISERFDEVNPADGKTYTVQYFERSRFELHPENAGSNYEVLLGLLGNQQARALGYFGPGTATGPTAGPTSYPRLGHAADWSWVAGQIVVTRIQGGCIFIRYDDNDALIHPEGPVWSVSEAAGLVTNGQYVIVFGHPPAPTDPMEMCPGGTRYVVDKLQANPADH